MIALTSRAQHKEEPLGNMTDFPSFFLVDLWVSWNDWEELEGWKENTTPGLRRHTAPPALQECQGSQTDDVYRRQKTPSPCDTRVCLCMVTFPLETSYPRNPDRDNLRKSCRPGFLVMPERFVHLTGCLWKLTETWHPNPTRAALLDFCSYKPESPQLWP